MLTDSLPCCFFFKDFIYLFVESQRERERERERQRHRQREKQAPRREPDVGFDPESPGSRTGPKAGAKPLRHPGIPGPSSFEVTGMLKQFKIPVRILVYLIFALYK